MLQANQVHESRTGQVEKLSLRQVARDLGISLNTVPRHLKDETPIGQHRGAARTTPVRDAVPSRVATCLTLPNPPAGVESRHLPVPGASLFFAVARAVNDAAATAW